MALIHEKLYQSKDFAHIDFGEYVRSLLAELRRAYPTDSQSIDFRVEADQVLLGVDTAIPCALIVNELVSNCLKHAFSKLSSSEELETSQSGVGPRAAMPGSGQPPIDGGSFTLPDCRGVISVAVISGKGNEVRLVVSDNGVGFPNSLDFRHTRSLGLQLVNTLTAQLGGSIEMHSNGGTEFRIDFSAKS